MVVLEVHRQPLYRRHFANMCSETGAFCVIQGFVLIFLPLIIAFSTAQFWTTDVLTYSQPRVQYAYTMMTEFYGTDSTGLPLLLTSSTSSFLSAASSRSLRQAVFQSAHYDDNKDGTADRFEVSVQLPLRSGESVTGLRWGIFFNTQLYDQVRYSFDSLAYCTYEGSTALRSVAIDGDFVVRQSDSLKSKGGTRTVSDTLLPTVLTRAVDAHSLSLADILSRYQARNLSMAFVPHSSSAVTALPHVMDTSPLYIRAAATVRVPVQTLRYVPPASQVLKQAWIQYVSFFLVVWFLLARLNSFVFSHRLLRSFAVTDIVVDKSS